MYVFTRDPDTIKSKNKCQPVFVLIMGFGGEGGRQRERKRECGREHVLPTLNDGKDGST